MINVKKHPGTVESYWDDKSWSIKGSIYLKKKRSVKNEEKIHTQGILKYIHVNKQLVFWLFSPH